MTSQYRHRRTAGASTAFPTLEPGEIAVNTANRQLAIGDAQTGQLGNPLPAIAVRFFDTRAQYVSGDYAVNAGVMYRANTTIAPGAFNPVQWDIQAGAVNPLYVEVAGDTMTGPLLLSNGTATNPGVGFATANNVGMFNGGGALNLTFGGVARLIVNASSISAAVPVTLQSGTQAAPGIQFGAEPTSGLFRKAAGNVSVSVSNSEVMNWATAGKITTAFGPVALPADPASALHAATKQYVDAGDTALGTSRVAKAGDTMSGTLVLSGNPVNPLDAVPLQYLNTRLNNVAAVITSDTPPVGVMDNTLWVETDSGNMFCRINDGNSTQWVQTPAAAPAGAVRYDVTQSLTAGQRTQVYSNIGPPPRVKNYIINGGMQVSQENGLSAVAATGAYPVDMFSFNFVTEGTQQAQAFPAAFNSNARIRVSTGTPDTTVGTTNCLFFQTVLEGFRVSDLRWGSVGAKTVTLQFGCRSSSAGTYSIAVCNGTATRSYVAEYVITAADAVAGDVVKSVTIPGCTDGSWATDNTAGMYIRWGFMAGTTYQQAAGAWATTASAMVGSPNQFNLMSAGSNSFDLFDVSLTEGSVAPPFQVPDYASELALCQRYYTKLSWLSLNGYSTAGAAIYETYPIPVPMRATPTITYTNLSSVINVTGLSVTIAAPEVFSAHALVSAAGAGMISFTATLVSRL